LFLLEDTLSRHEILFGFKLIVENTGRINYLD